MILFLETGFATAVSTNGKEFNAQVKTVILLRRKRANAALAV